MRLVIFERSDIETRLITDEKVISHNALLLLAIFITPTCNLDAMDAKLVV